MMKWQSVLVWILTVTFSAPPVTEPQVDVDGLVRLIEYVDVPARRDGRLEKIEVKEGTYIHRADVLGKLDDTEAKLTLKRTELEHNLAVEKAKSEIAINSARLIQEHSRNEFQRARQAKQSAPGSISVTEFERLKLEADKATNELARLSEEKSFAVMTAESKAVELQLAKLALEERQIVSPLDGIVVQIHRREGEWVHLGEKVIRLVRIDRLRVEAYVNLNSKLASLENAPVQLTVEFPDSETKTFSGEIVFINPEADPVNGQIRIWAEIENRDRLLRPGQRWRMKFLPKVPVDSVPSASSDTAPSAKPR